MQVVGHVVGHFGKEVIISAKREAKKQKRKNERKEGKKEAFPPFARLPLKYALSNEPYRTNKLSS
jgi:hypothetical protein